MRGSEFWRPPNTIKESVIFRFEIVHSKFWYGTKGHTPVSFGKWSHTLFVPPSLFRAPRRKLIVQ